MWRLYPGGGGGGGGRRSLRVRASCDGRYQQGQQCRGWAVGSKGAGPGRAVRGSLGKRVTRGGPGVTRGGRWPPSALPPELTAGAAPAAWSAVLRVPGGC